MPLEIPQLDDRDFEQIVEEAVARIPVHTPEWSNFNHSDPGMTLVQLFAFMTDSLLYRSNRIPEKNRIKFLSLLGIPLQPATPGRGLVAFRNERGPVEPLQLPEETRLRAGKVPFLTSLAVNVLPVTAAVYYKKPRTDVDESTRQQYRQLYATELESGGEGLLFYRSMPLEPPETGKPLPQINLSNTADTIDRSLWVALIAPKNVPVSKVRAAVAEQTLCLGVYPTNEMEGGRRLKPLTIDSRPVEDPGLVIEIAAPEPTSPESLPPPNYQPLTIERAEDVLEQPGVIWVTLPSYEKLERLDLWDFDPTEEGIRDYPPEIENAELAARVVTWLRIRRPAEEERSEGMRNGTATAASEAPSAARLSWVGVNVTRVVQAVPVRNERLGVGTGAPYQTYQAAHTPVIAGVLTIASPWRQPPSTFRLEIQDDREEWKPWDRTDDLWAHGPDDHVYTLDPESGEIQFGDGLHGRRPPLNRQIRASYQYGGGPQGQVAIGAIKRSPALPGGYKVENPVRTWGASAGETISQGERSISHYLRHRDRLVTEEDFVEIARRTPGVNVGRVEALSLFNPNQFDESAPNEKWPGSVTVMVVPETEDRPTTPPEPDRLFLDAVCDWLNPRRLVTTELFVRGPQYVHLWVTVGLVTMPGHMRSIVHQAVQDALRGYLSPLTGGPRAMRSSGPPSPASAGAEQGWPLWMDVRKQDLEAVAVRVEGVRYVTEVRLGTLGPDGVTMKAVESTLPIRGVQLPWLAGVRAAEGDAPHLDDFTGTESARGFQVPVPLQPRTCY